MSRHSDMRGFTLIELLVAIGLMGIALGIAVPNLASLVRNSQVEAQAQTLNSLMQFARSAAVIRRVPVTISNAGDVWTIATSSQTLRQETLNPVHATIATSPDPISLTYSSTGTSSSTGETRITICRDDLPALGYLLTIDRNGSSRLHNRGKDSDTGPLGDCTP